MSAKEDFIMYAGLGIAAVIGLVWLAKRAQSVASAALDSAGTALNPLDTHNVIYTAVNKTGAAMSGDSAFSLGGWFYDKFHQDPMMQSTLPEVPANPPRMGDAGLPLLNKAGTGEPGSGYDYMPGGSFEAAKSAPSSGYDYMPGGSFEAAKSAPVDPYAWWPVY
jgi:hypothetical protein